MLAADDGYLSTSSTRYILVACISLCSIEPYCYGLGEGSWTCRWTCEWRIGKFADDMLMTLVAYIYICILSYFSLVLYRLIWLRELPLIHGRPAERDLSTQIGSNVKGLWGSQVKRGGISSPSNHLTPPDKSWNGALQQVLGRSSQVRRSSHPSDRRTTTRPKVSHATD